MILDQFETFPYSIPFKKPLRTSQGIYSNREGIWIKFSCDGLIGIGEAAPLQFFSNESLKDVYYALESFYQSIENENCSEEDLLSLIDVHTIGIPSAKFALETMLFDIIGQNKGISIAEHLNPDYLSKIKINGIAGLHHPDDKYEVIKVKMGYSNLFDEIEYVDKLTNYYGENIKFRIDLNGSLDLTRSIRLCKELEKFNIDYVEQPISAYNLEDLAELRYHTSIPIALDESLTDYNSAEEIIEKQAADILIIKPMVSGGFIECRKIINLAKIENIESIITSSLESSIGQIACLHLAGASKIEKPCGLSTGVLLKEELVQFPIKSNLVFISGMIGLGIKLKK